MSPMVSKTFEIGLAVAVPLIAGSIAYGVMQSQVATHNVAISAHATKIGVLEVSLARQEARQDARWEAVLDRLNSIQKQLEKKP
jgi:hypothetical protein